MNDTTTSQANDNQQAPYQVLPPMAPEQFEALKQDIAERGVLTPIDLDEQGCVLDGHHRLRACAELGITDYPMFVRVDLKTDAEKRTYARQVNTLRRHLTRAQMRELIAGQLRDTPEWADARIARALGVTDKTVRAVRRRLEATSEIPRLTTFEGADGKTRPSTQTARAIFAASQEDFDWNDLRRLIEQAAISPSDPFEGCSESEIRDWHLFVLFLVQQCGYSVDGAGIHVEWVRRRPFQTVVEWLSDEGAAWRGGGWVVPASTLRAWTAFAADQGARTSAELVTEPCTAPDDRTAGVWRARMSRPASSRSRRLRRDPALNERERLDPCDPGRPE